MTVSRKPTSLDVMDTLQKLCKRHDPALVLGYVKDWVAYMDRQIAITNEYFQKEQE